MILLSGLSLFPGSGYGLLPVIMRSAATESGMPNAMLALSNGEAENGPSLAHTRTHGT